MPGLVVTMQTLTTLERHALMALLSTAVADAGQVVQIVDQLQVVQRDFSALDPMHCCGFYVTFAPHPELVGRGAVLQHAMVAGAQPDLPAGAMFMLFTRPEGSLVLEMACFGDGELPVARLLAESHGFGALV